ncbi:MAG TPA: DUF2017 family protein [Mycobacteriales bacterium]|jgi:hypothetical protein|nr:DUF2017 family protein [Mycobacteriales bacterium]
MARAFRRSGDRVVTRLEPYAAALLRGLVGDVVTLVRADGEDPVTRRLFPDASPDPEIAAELRDLLHDDLREAKLANARALLESLPDDGQVELDVETAEQWLAALNDVRLALGTALHVTAESQEREVADDDVGMHVYDLLTFLQDSLVSALSAGVEG